MRIRRRAAAVFGQTGDDIATVRLSMGRQSSRCEEPRARRPACRFNRTGPRNQVVGGQAFAPALCRSPPPDLALLTPSPAASPGTGEQGYLMPINVPVFGHCIPLIHVDGLFLSDDSR